MIFVDIMEWRLGGVKPGFKTLSARLGRMSIRLTQNKEVK
jgi:hypothetical protein